MATGAHEIAAEPLVVEHLRGLLADLDPVRPPGALLAEVGPAIAEVAASLPAWLVRAKAPAFATAERLIGALDVVTVATECGIQPEAAAACDYGLGRHLDFAWPWARLGEAGDEDRWQHRAAEGLVTDLLRARRRLRARKPAALPARLLAAIEALVGDVRALARPGLAAPQVIGHEIRRLAETVPAPRT